MDADGSLFDAALLSAVAAFSHCKFAIAWIFLSFFVVITCPMRDNKTVLYILSYFEIGKGRHVKAKFLKGFRYQR